mmetsp:Transcript_6272/g.13453  ORF Transcript_6272/g.13453 Transcript_6272/m.13453 type:complete len:102 (+) Transcript_6272:1084-1389(+)
MNVMIDRAADMDNKRYRNTLHSTTTNKNYGAENIHYFSFFRAMDLWGSSSLPSCHGSWIMGSHEYPFRFDLRNRELLFYCVSDIIGFDHQCSFQIDENKSF